MKGLKGVVVTLVTIGIFAFALISFGINTAIDNNANMSIADHPAIAEFNESLASNFGSYESDANESMGRMLAEEQKTGLLDMVSNAVTRVWTTMVRIPKTIYTLTVGFIGDTIFGDSSGGSQFTILLTLITSIVIVIVGLYAWKWIRSGTPD